MINTVDIHSNKAHNEDALFTPAREAGMKNNQDHSIYVIVYISLVILLLLGAIFITTHRLAVIPPSA